MVRICGTRQRVLGTSSINSFFFFLNNKNNTNNDNNNDDDDDDDDKKDMNLAKLDTCFGARARIDPVLYTWKRW